MSLFSKTPPPEEDLDEDYIAPEVAALQRQKRLWLILLSLVVVAAVLAVLAARPLGRAIKSWQAGRAAAQVDDLLAKKDFKAAQGKVQDALALSPQNKLAMRAAGRFLSKAGSGAEAVSFWQKVETRMPLTADDERLYATSLLVVGDGAGAQKHLEKAWPDRKAGGPDDWGLGLSLALQKRDETEAVRLALRLIEDPATPVEQRLRPATLLTAASTTELRTQAWQSIRTISEQKDEMGLEALITMARRWVTIKKNGGSLDAGEGIARPGEIADALDANPKSGAKYQLFAIDLRLLVDPLQSDELIARAKEKFSKNDDDLEVLTAWLYGKGEYRKVLALLPEDVAVHRQALFLQRLDTMAAMGQWQTVRETIQQSRFSLDRVTAELYIARCDAQLGSPTTSEVHWQAALDAAGSDVRQLDIVAGYAVKSGREKFAEAAAQGIVAADPKARGSYEMLLKIYQGRRDTERLNEILQQMAGQWPNDDAVRNDFAYSSLLLGRNLAAAQETAEALFQKNPTSLPHRITLALAKYRAADFSGGLALLRNIEGETAPLTERMGAVKAALLWALDRKGEAAVALDSVKPELLFPEEQKLIAPVLQSMK